MKIKLRQVNGTVVVSVPGKKKWWNYFIAPAQARQMAICMLILADDAEGIERPKYPPKDGD